MDEAFIRHRLTDLRMKKNISEYKMSMDLGHSNSYIHSISSGRALPSLSEFLYICEYFGITPKEFFDEGIDHPQMLHRLIESATKLDDEKMGLLVNLSEILAKK